MLSVLLIYNPMTDSSTEEFSSAPTTSGTVLPAEDRVNSTIATTTAVNGLELVNRSVSEWGRTVLSALFVLEILLLILGVVVLIRLRYFVSCTGRYSPIRVMTVVVAVNWSVTVLVLLTVWCVFDRAGRSWVKTRRFQQQQQQRQQQRRSVLDATKRRKTGSSRRRNLKHRQALLQYEQIWDRRFRRMFCCLSNSEASGAGSTEGAFAEVARLFSDFFQDLDVVPSDVVAGLVLLRRCQKLLARETLKDKSNQVLQFMSGRPIYLSTNFLQLTDPIELSNYRIALRCMKYALAAYGCPMLAYTGRLCCLLCDLNMCCCGSAQTLTREDRPRRDSTASCSSVCNSADNDYCDSDNSDRSQTAGCCCCRLYRPEASIEALLRQRGIDGSQFRLLHLCTDLGIERTPFYVGIDYRMRRVIVAIRGTLSLQDVLTDLTADSEAIPGCGSGGGAVEDDSDEGWFGHRGMVRTAIYIQSTLAKRRLIEQALDEPNCQNFDLILTGHSLGAGIASILGLLMRPIYGQRLQVLAFSPPVAASAEDKPLSDEDDEDSDNFEMPMRSQLQRPVSLHENLSGYCYYLFPDEESGRRR
uniref:sn-1-specific diacylglycerol lipase n=1 Tax=Macrostomum lignano TaxID=282301 RepID=A0A1I8HGW0_9PLAT